jgi:hypothetical protein
LIAIALLSAGSEIRRFFDPCFFFGDTGGGPTFSAPCRGRMAGTSETMAQVILRLALVQGTAVGTAVLALKGVYRGKRRLILVASFVLFVLTVPLIIGMAGFVTLVCAVCFLLSYLFSYASPIHTQIAN